MNIVAVTHKAWIADTLGATQSFGFSLVPISDGETFIWTPGLHATAAYLQGHPYPLTSTLTWPECFDEQFLGRSVTMLTGDELDRESTVPEFVKLADVKNDRFPAEITTQAQFRKQLYDRDLDSEVIVSDVVENIADEYRLVVLDGEILDSSHYRRGDTYFDGGIIASSHSFRDIEKFAADAVASTIGTAMPRSYMLDIGITTDGTMFVIEANPIWCSNWYGNDVTLFIMALEAEYTDDGPSIWQPDPMMIRQARMMQILR